MMQLNRVVAGLLWCMCVALAAVGVVGIERASADPPVPEELAVGLKDASTPILFVRLPRSDNIEPLVTGEDQSTAEFHTAATYLGQTEVSLATVKQLLSETAWDQYQQRVLSLSGSDNDLKWSAYRKAVRAGSPEYPAILLGLAEIVEMCGTLNKQGVVNKENINLDYERLSFRIPARMEWQYAARAVTTMDERKKTPHFPHWIRYDEVKNLVGRIKDLQKEVGDDENPAAVATQEGFLKLVDRAKEAKNKKGYSILGLILKKALGFKPNIGVATDSGIEQCVSNAPNRWGFHHLIGNVPEWVLTTTDQESLEKKWDQFLNTEDLASLGEEEFGISMGGSFIHLTHGKRGWAKYSLSGGDPLDPSNLEPEPYKVSECLGSDASGSVGLEDTNSGARLLLVRTESPDWFKTFRKSTFLKQDLESLDKVVDSVASTMRDISAPKAIETKIKLLEFYRELTKQNTDMSVAQWHPLARELSEMEFHIIEGDHRKETATWTPEDQAAIDSLNDIAGDFDFGDSSDADEESGESEDAGDQSSSSDAPQEKTDFFAITHEIAVLDAAVQH